MLRVPQLLLTRVIFVVRLSVPPASCLQLDACADFWRDWRPLCLAYPAIHVFFVVLLFFRGTLSAASTSSTTGRVRVLMVGLAAALCDPARDPIADAQRGCESEQPDIVGSGRQCVGCLGRVQ